MNCFQNKTLVYYIIAGEKKKKALKTYPENKGIELFEMSDLESAYGKVCFVFPFCAFKSQMGVKWPKSLLEEDWRQHTEKSAAHIAVLLFPTILWLLWGS